MPLKVLHLSTYSGGGGAARAASNVNQALQRAGIDSRMATANGNRFKLARAADRALWRLQRSPVETWRSPARFGSLTAKEINASSADIVNLHWVTDGFLSIEEIGKIKKPVVISMYDMWPFCGTEHYGVDSPQARWRTGYTRANRNDGEIGFDLDRYSWERKAKTWRDFHMVPASSWLEQATRESALCANWPTTRIPHAVDESKYRPYDQVKARQEFGLARENPIIGFIASAGIGDRRKGFDLLTEAVRYAKATLPNLQIAVVGPRSEGDEVPPDLAVHFLGTIDDNSRMTHAYSAFDLLSVPSREDNLPLTAIEAQMCGRPVTGFSVGGLVDIVNEAAGGYLASPWDTRSFANGLVHVLKHTRESKALRRDIRERAVDIWGLNSIARRYSEVYQRCLASR